MKKNSVKGLAATLALLVSHSAFATNGDILEGIGATSEALGGTGVAAPQDSLTAIVNNPAGLSFTPSADKGDATVGTTFFQPDVKAKISTPAGTLSGSSDDPVSIIPFLGLSKPLNDKWSLGFGAYGVAGLGVDYRGQGWDLNPANPGNEGDVHTAFGNLKIAPALSYKAGENFSVGAAVQGNYSTLDLGQEETDALGAGLLVGATYKVGSVQIGASYTTPQKAKFEKVYNFDAFAGDTQKDDLTLEQPAIYAAGLSWEPTDTLLFEVNAKHLGWADAEGYSDFDWEDQWVYAIGAQYKASEALALRAGFNYAQNPVAQHNGWNPQGISTVQGKQVPTFGYELLRNVGFPAIVESHLTLGFGYQITDALALNAAYLHAFEQELTSTSAGGAIGFESTLSEDSLGLSLSWAFN